MPSEALSVQLLEVHSASNDIDGSTGDNYLVLGRLYYSIVPSFEISGSVCLFVCVHSPGQTILLLGVKLPFLPRRLFEAIRYSDFKTVRINVTNLCHIERTNQPIKENNIKLEIQSVT